MVKKKSDWEVLTDEVACPRTTEEARALLRRVYKTPTIEITDPTELDNMMLIFKLMDPVSESNNQHSWSETYIIGDQKYILTTFVTSKQKNEYSLSRECTWEEIGL